MNAKLYRLLRFLRCMALLPCLVVYTSAEAQQVASLSPDEVLSSDQWQQVDASIDKGLRWLASQQQPNGSFPTLMHGQPGVTSLCVMAFAAQGHLPGEGPYGEQLRKSVEFIISCQKPSGLLALVGPRGATLSRNVGRITGSTATYNHALSGILLSEVYAMGSGADRADMETAIENALKVTLEMQTWPKFHEKDKGGWRYVDEYTHEDSDLSVSGWHLMFLRSAKNAGFEVPEEPITKAVEYVRRCYRPKFGTYLMIAKNDSHRTRGMAGAGIIAMAHAGIHDAPETKKVGDWILANGFAKYNEVRDFNNDGHSPDDRYHYGAFLCTQAMYQLGGTHWEKFYPPMAKTLLNNQNPRGFWKPESHTTDTKFGSAYTTALAVLTLGAPNQLLPIFQK